MSVITFTTIEHDKELDVLAEQKASYKHLSFYYSSELIAELKERLKHKNSLYLMAKSNGVFAGFIAMNASWWEPDFFFIQEIIVNPKFHRQKIGSQLIQKCIDFAHEKNQIGIVTETDFKNIPFQNLLKKFGFKEWENPQWKDGFTFKLVF